MKITQTNMNITQRLSLRKIGIYLVLSIMLLTGLTGHVAYASESFVVKPWTGIDLATGLMTIDPTVITLIVGNGEITIISSPEIAPLFEFTPQVDLYFGLTTDPDDPIEVIAEQIVGMAVLTDTAFEDVTDDLLATLDFTERTVKIDSNDIVVLLLNQDQEEYAMLGDVTKYPDATVSFTYWKSEIPEVSTLVLLGVGIVGLFGITRWRQHNRSRKGGTSMKHFKTLLFALVLLPLLVGTASAAEVELRVINVGNGIGIVRGDGIRCGHDCKETYPEKTIVHLKAIPLSNSRFVGWLVDDKPSEGVLTIEKDTIVKAIFELQTGMPDELTVSWYNRNIKKYTTLVLNEVVIFFENWHQVGIVTEEEYEIAIQKIAHQFHPQAVIVKNNEVGMLLKCPESFTKEQLLNLLSLIKENTYVQQASPVFYNNPESRRGFRALTGNILVKFPPDYVEDQILTIENEYGLKRVEPFVSKNSFVYQTNTNLLELIDIANLLYESGKVEYSSPDWVREISGAMPNDSLFEEQWNLYNKDNPHEDVKLVEAWEQDCGGSKCRGSENEVIAIVDSGVEITHKDLKPNVLDGKSWDFTGLLFEDNDPSPGSLFSDPHGTNVSGIAVARGFSEDNEGISGAAPWAKLIGHRVNLGLFWSDSKAAKALIRSKELIDIYNCSWGDIDTAFKLQELHPAIEDVLEEGTIGLDEDGDGEVEKKPGRQGLGNIYVFAAGNDATNDANTNYTGFTNSRYGIVVGASDLMGSYSLYSTPGATVLVNAPSSSTFDGGTGNIVTTDLGSTYTHEFGGTSASAPLISGVIALILQANPNKLTWRDIQYILAEVAEQNEPMDNSSTDPDSWKWNSGWKQDGVSMYHTSSRHGFGRINAAKAIEIAGSWIPVPEAICISGSPEKEPDMITIPENIQIEFIEVYFTSDHPQWGDLSITLISPHNTRSALAKKHKSDNGIYYDWRFGSFQYWGERSQGNWYLEVDGGKFQDWELKIYGTELPSTPPYVQEVEVTQESNTDPLYHAEWVVEEDGQLEFVESVEPQNPSNTTPLHLTIVTSEAMQWLSLNLFDQDFSSDSTDPARKIQKADKTGTIWEVTIDPADVPQDNNGEFSDVYTLTIAGQDSGDLYLLPFADRTPKTIPTHPSDADWPAQPNAGDTVHQIGKILSEPFHWSIILPTPGECDYDFDHGGIVCTFDEGAGFTLTDVSLQALRDAGVPEAIIDSVQSLQGQRFATEQAFVEAVHAQLGLEHTAQYLSLIQEHAETARGRVILYPRDFDAIKANVQYVVIGSGGQNSSTWDGTYQVPTEGSGDLALGVAWEPQEAWFPFREPTPDQQELWCAENPPDYKPNEPKGPPASDTDTATLPWTISAQPNPDTASCQVRVTWETAAVAEETRTLTIDLQPQRLCEAFQNQAGTVEATATYPWEVVDRLEYTGCHITEQETEVHEDIGGYHLAKYWPISTWEKVLEPGQCRSWYKKEQMYRFHPEWWPSPPPQDVPFPTSPEEGNIAIHYDCEWQEKENTEPFCLLVYKTHHWSFTYRCPTMYVENEGRQKPSVGGYVCDKTITHLTWECGDQCTYQELSGEFVPPVPVLERELSLGP